MANTVLLQLGTVLKITLRLQLRLVAFGSCTMDCQEETVCILKLQGMFLLVQKYYSLLNALCCARLVGRWIYCKRATLGIDSKFVLL